MLYRFIDLYWLFSDRKRDVYVTTQKINRTLLKATLLGSYWARGHRPDPAKLPKGNFDSRCGRKRGGF